MKHKINSLLLASTLLTGCTTMQHLDSVGDEYNQGNYISATALLVLLTPITLIADIFTLGGSMDAQQSADTWSSLASQQAQLEQQNQYLAQQQLIQQQLAAQAAQTAAQEQFEQQRRQQEFYQQQAQQQQAQLLASNQPSFNNGTTPASSGSTASATIATPQPKQEIIQGQVLSASYAADGTEFIIQVRNVGNVKISCTFPVDYRFPRNGNLSSERTTINSGLINVGATATARLSSSYNIKVDGYSMNCSRWPFQ